MTSVHSYNRYSDNLARKKRRRFFILLSVFIVSALFAGAGLFYGLFISSAFQINKIDVLNLKTLESEDVLAVIESTLNDKTWPLFSIEPQKNIFLFDQKIMRSSLLESFPIIEDITISKEYRHKIVIEIEERKAIGTWCFIEECKYFDEEGFLWGQALKSSGTLLLIIEDLRPNEEENLNIQPNLIEAIKKSRDRLESLEIKIKKIQIPTDSIADFRVYTANGYYILIDAESDIEKQLSTLEIFLKDKGRDFNSEYVDIRIEGRVYYK